MYKTCVSALAILIGMTATAYAAPQVWRSVGFRAPHDFARDGLCSRASIGFVFASRGEMCVSVGVCLAADR